MSSPARAVGRRRARSRAVAAGLLLLAAGAVGLSGTAARAAGALYLTETFTGASADPLFTAYGSACLTGAPPGTLAPGAHPLGGCADGNLVSSPPRDAAPFGFLQLTDASTDQSGAVLFDTPIPATQGLTITFEQWQYGTTTATPAPADGIAFFLVDGDAQLTAPGAFGGSLGYAQKRPDGVPTNPIIPGVVGGYLGIGLDVLGNYFGDWEDRSNGCPADQRSPAGSAFRIPERDKITVRGPADPADPTRGYCFLTSTADNLGVPAATSWPSNLPVTLHGLTATVPVGTAPEQAQALLAPDRRTIEVTITPAPDPQVTVAITGADGIRHQVLAFAAPQPVPDSYKFGFSASTGLFTDVHLIRNVVLESVAPAPILTLTKTSGATAPVRAGDTISYSYQVVNTGLAPVQDLVVDDDKIAAVTCERTTLLAVGDAPDNQTTCHGSYVVTDADAAAGSVTNVAFASADGGGALSAPDDLTVLVMGATPTPDPSATAGAPPGATAQPLPATGAAGTVPLLVAGLTLSAFGTLLTVVARRARSRILGAVDPLVGDREPRRRHG
ncbi:DUF7507 domain-containing protein [Cellulomonas soli]|uniref:DUF7507 domain-containing protein n=1 Tax=Cellulomonas soli TaxID=931535 RepID=UPI0011BDC65E|nr:hypothetical protein [Cellulomonas soli]NYI60098.1 hypothetical protein [Cellulomonas soli]